MKTSFFKRAVLCLTAITSLSLSAQAEVSYTISPITSTNGYTVNTQIVITGIDVVNYYGPGNFLYNIKLSYKNTVTGTGNSGDFYSYQVFFAKNNNFFQSAQSTSSVAVATRNGTMTSYGPNSGTAAKVNGTGLYTDNDVINDLVDGVKLAVSAPGVNTTAMGTATPTTPIAPLPVTLSKFSAAAKGQNTVLYWETLSEQNNKGFEIERSNDAATWTTAGFVATQAAEGNSKEALTYQYAELNTGKKSFYRLKQIDMNGAQEYSAIVSVEGVKNAVSVTAYPNPTSNLVNVNTNQPVYVYNSVGQVQQVAITQSEQQTTIHLGTLANGTYYVQAGQETIKVMLQK